MKIVFVGGGTGGHFYPLIAVAEELKDLVLKNRVVEPSLYYLGPNMYDEKALYKVGMKYVYCPSAKVRVQKNLFSILLNILSAPIIILGILKALFVIYRIFPDVVFSKGGYAAFPVLYAARILKIPVVIHDSDSVLGRVSTFSSKFAKKIAISYVEAEQYLSKKALKKTALTGVPIMRDLRFNPLENAHGILKLHKEKPVVLILGGSTGSQYINENILDALPQLIKKYQVVHQVGKNNYERIVKLSDSMLSGIQEATDYHPVAYLSPYYMRAAFSASDIVISRSGSSALFEIAGWGIPTIAIPIPNSVSRDQVKNAYSFARLTGIVVIEQSNLRPSILLDQIRVLLNDEERKRDMSEKLKKVSTPDAAKKIAQALMDILIEHEL